MFEFMQDKHMSQSVDMAKMVQREVCSAAGRPNRGVHQAGFLVLRCTMMPSCLIELGFISTPSEETLMNNNSQLNKMARGIYNAFVCYKKKYYKNGRNARIIKNDEPVDENVPAVVSAEVEEEPVSKSRNVEKENVSSSDSNSAPVFKVQIMAGAKLSKGSKAFKGLDADSYVENGVVKYTVGSSTDYNEIYRLRKSIIKKFPEAFIIAFRGNQKMDVQKAIQEFKNKRK